MAGTARETGVRTIAPTDIAQFIRLEQCQRYLRLRLRERADGRRFLYDYGVRPQSIPALLTESGARFEQMVEEAVSRRYWKINFVGDMAHAGRRAHDNERVLHIARNLSPDEVAVLFQPRLLVHLGGWRLRGDVDLLRLERHSDGALHILIADMKASTTAKVEHRLQVAFYVEMLSALFAEAGIEHMPIEMGILYRGPARAQDGDTGVGRDRRSQCPAAPVASMVPTSVTHTEGGGTLASPVPPYDESHDDSRSAGTDEQEGQRSLAEAMFATRDALLEIVPDPDNYRASVRDLVTAVDSTAAAVAETDLAELPFHLSYKCDGCLYNEFCLKWTAEHDDLSLLPHITPEEKGALRRAGITTTAQLARLKTFRGGNGPAHHSDLIPGPGQEALVRRLAATWPVGPRLDELVIRARTYRRWKGEKDLQSLSYIPSKGYGPLPFCSASQNPNLIRIYIDAQHDYLHDRIYLLGALVACSEGGEEPPHRRRSIVHLAEGPPDTHEKEEALFLRFTEDLLRAVVELAAPDEEGKPRAPIHLIFFNHFEQRLLLDGLARHFNAILGATPLYDLVTQGAAFDSPIATFLDEEIRELKNYPMVCQSLQAVAAYLRFDWNTPEPYREIFRTRMFDFWGKFDDPNPDENPWYTNRARFNSQIPLEYAYAAWHALSPPGKSDDFASYRGATPELLRGFHARRLEAIERIAKDFRGNEKTEKRRFDLPDLHTFEARAETMAQALDEFVTIERHVELNEWKRVHLLPPERRVLLGETLIARYHEADQDSETAERNRENARRRALREEYAAAWWAEHPDAKRLSLPKEQRDECKWSQEGMRFRLRLEPAGLDCDLDEALALSTFRPGERLIIFERTTVDSRLPQAEQAPMQPTPKQLLYAMRCTLIELKVERDEEEHALAATVEIEMEGTRSTLPGGFLFGTMDPRPLMDGEVYTLDSDPNAPMGYMNAKVTAELAAREAASLDGRHNALYDRLVRPDTAHADWPNAAAQAQERFLAGLDALQEAGAFHPLEPSKRQYIGAHGNTPALLVQGPPGTGKSYSTAFALFARLQGALAADRPFRAFLTCKTHAATDVLLQQAVHVQDDLRRWAASHPDLFATYFDARLLQIPLFRVTPRSDLPAGVIGLPRKEDRPPGTPLALDAITAAPQCITAATPGGIYRLLKDRWDDLFDHNDIADCLVLDEASQMNLPEAVLAALPLKPEGQLIVVGDHRQMPPIVKHDWAGEPRRTFAAFRSYESLFLALLAGEPPMIKFEESFRLHADMAEFLRREIYHLDGINYHSKQRHHLAPADHPDPYVAAALRPEHTIVVIVHDEAGSLHRNEVEQRLIAPILAALADGAGLGPERGLGVVVPHRAQRAALQEALPQLNILDPRTGAVTRSAVDTVERFQGDERNVILVGATESDPQYLLLSSQFLLDPRRLTVALSRAKNKMILVASKSVFGLFSAEEETFAHAQLWKNLLRSTCTERLWSGERDGHGVTVWGNASSTDPHRTYRADLLHDPDVPNSSWPMAPLI